MNKFLLWFFLVAIVLGCKDKVKNEPKHAAGEFFAVLPYMQAQVKNIDTSLYRITKIEKVDSVSDTTIISREAFRDYAKDFVTIPDITTDDKKDNYSVSNSYDADLKSTLLTYMATSPDEEIRQETVMIDPDPAGGLSNVSTIIIKRYQTSKDSTVEKDMTWYVNSHFQVVTKIHKANEPEKIKILQVKWE
jgi:hypothetical protein